LPYYLIRNHTRPKPDISNRRTGCGWISEYKITGITEEPEDEAEGVAPRLDKEGWP